MEINTEKIKYILYARKSTESEDKQATSIDDQIREMENVAKKLGLNIIDTITESMSAKKPGRKGFNQMLENIHSGKANGILCWKLNRLARNPVDGGQISWMLQQNHIQHIQTYSNDYKPTDNVLMMQVEFGMANQYVNDLSVDVRRGMRAKAMRGWCPVAHLTVGYFHNTGKYRECDGDEIISADSYDSVRYIWDLMLTGEYSVSDIMREGYKKGLVNRKTGKGFSRNTYYHIFTNEFYIGYFYWKDENGKSVRIHGKHKPMVTETEFNRVQILLGKKGRPTRVNKCDFPYRGPIYCSECKCAVSAEHKLQLICTNCKNKFSIKTRKDCPRCGTDTSEMKNPSIVDKTYYRCTKRRGNCSQKSVKDTELKKQIENELSKINIPHDFYEWAVNALKELNSGNADTNQKRHAELKKKETETLQRIDNLVLMRANSEITAEQMTKARDQADEELINIRKETKVLHGDAIDWLDIANKYLRFAELAVTEFDKADNDKKRAILNTLGSNLVLKDQKLIIDLIKPLSNINKLYVRATEEIERSEPKIAHVKHGRFDSLNPKSSVLCAE